MKDLTTALNLDCIDINTSNVTIDLNGHTLYGAGTTLGTVGTGIYDLNTLGSNNISIFNGTVRDFYFYGIFLYGSQVQVSRVNVSYNRENGIVINSGSVFDCNASYNTVDGIACENGGIIRNNNATNNGSYGIYCGGGGGTVISGNNLSYNNSDGINGGNATIFNNFAYYNHGNGITITNGVVENNTADSNYNGITAQGSMIIGNFCHQNNTGGAGIQAFYNNTIENNTVYANSTGIFAAAQGNYIAGNQIRLNTVSITTSAGNSLGDGTTGFYNKIQ